MSELKGQLLGILLVIGIFGVLSAAMSGVFDNFAKQISEEITGIELPSGSEPAPVNYLHY